jgi:hypothetical protein
MDFPQASEKQSFPPGSTPGRFRVRAAGTTLSPSSTHDSVEAKRGSRLKAMAMILFYYVKMCPGHMRRKKARGRICVLIFHHL